MHSHKRIKQNQDLASALLLSIPRTQQIKARSYSSGSGLLLLSLVLQSLEESSVLSLTYLSIVGNDLRKAVGDGHPAENAIASDLHQGTQKPPSRRGFDRILTFSC